MKYFNIFLLVMMTLALLSITACNKSSINGDNGSTTVSVFSGTEVVLISQDGATITWVTRVNTIGQVEYGLDTNYDLTTPIGTDLTIIHSYKLDGLEPDTTYYYRVKVWDADDNETVSEGGTFITLSDG